MVPITLVGRVTQSKPQRRNTSRVSTVANRAEQRALVVMLRAHRSRESDPIVT